MCGGLTLILMYELLAVPKVRASHQQAFHLPPALEHGEEAGTPGSLHLGETMRVLDLFFAEKYVQHQHESDWALSGYVLLATHLVALHYPYTVDS